MEVYDFGGYGTRANVRCSDGRTIQPGAFKECDGKVVPLVYQHGHSEMSNIIGHALLEEREDGVYVYGSFNDTPKGKLAKTMVEHGDLKSLSIFANQLKEKAKNVIHGVIREVSLVMAGANPGAYIETLAIEHSDGETTLTDSAEMYFNEPFSVQVLHADSSEADGEGETISQVFNTLDEKQKDAVYAIMAHAMQGLEDDDEVEHEDTSNTDSTLEHNENDEGDDTMKENAFEKKTPEKEIPGVKQHVLTHEDFKAINDRAKQCGSFREAFIEHAASLDMTPDALMHSTTGLRGSRSLAHATTYGIDPIDTLFPDAKLITPTPEMVTRDMTWVPKVLGPASKSPFARIKSTSADITADEARAKGYITGNKKVEEVIKVSKRVTTPTTVYKKQKLDRDDIIDITEMNVVMWIRAEMQVMLKEEIARAILIGDGRQLTDPDSINPDNVRPILEDDDFYSVKITPIAANATGEDQVEAVIRARKQYKGSGSPTYFTTEDNLTDMLLSKDTIGRRLYTTEAELASALRVSEIVTVEVMEGLTRETTDNTPRTVDVLGIIVNMRDYKIGADKGGEISAFDDFDIDYNQYKYLLETRISGALFKPFSALVIQKEQ